MGLMILDDWTVELAITHINGGSFTMLNKNANMFQVDHELMPHS